MEQQPAAAAAAAAGETREGLRTELLGGPFQEKEKDQKKKKTLVMNKTSQE